MRARIALAIEELLRLRGPLSARALAQLLAQDFQDLDKSLVNGVLYSLPDRFVHDEQGPPLWRCQDQAATQGHAVQLQPSVDWDTRAREIAESELDMNLTDLVPELPRQLPLRSLALPTRVRNALWRGSIQYPEDLDGLTVRDLHDFRGVGPGVVAAIISSLMEANQLHAALVTDSITDELVEGPGVSGEPDLANSDLGSSPATTLMEDLVTVARWFHTIGQTAQALLEVDESELPPLIADALRTLRGASARDILGPGGPTAATVVDTFLTQFSDRELLILAARTFGRSPQTLEEVGTQLGLTRERVRQIEQRCLQGLAAMWHEEPMLVLLADATRQKVGTVLPLTALLDSFPALAEPVACLGEPLWFVIDRVDDEFQIVDGWCVSGSMADAREATLDALASVADDYGLLPLSAASSELGLAIEHSEADWGVRRWLAECGFPILQDHVMTKSRALPDRAVAVLALEGKPMTAEEIHIRLGEDRSLSSLRNAVAGDPRISRVGVGVWALKDWGHDEYTGIRELIRTELEKAGGRVNCDLLVSTLANQFGVAENSVRTYAASAPFELRDGYVQMARIDADVRRRRRPAKRLFFNDGAWRLRVSVTSEHLRGSGFPMQNGVADAVGLGRGDRLDIPSRLGPQSVSWVGPQPTFGTIRRFLMDLGSCPDDEVFLVFEDGHFDVEPMAVVQDGDVTRQLLALSGLPQDCPDPLPALCIAVGLPADSSKVSLIDTLTGRGDDDLAGLLTHIPDRSSRASADAPVDIDTLMDLIG